MRKLADGSGSERRADSGFVRIIGSFMALETSIARLSEVLEEITLPGIPAKLDDDDSLVIALKDFVTGGDVEAFSDDATSPG